MPAKNINFDSTSSRAEQYSELGSSQQCEHANKEVTLRAPKSHHYGNSESLDFQVYATVAFVNEGRSYISQVKKNSPKNVPYQCSPKPCPYLHFNSF